MKLICLGDSITEGYGVLPGNAYTDILEKNYGITIINEGLCGRTANDMFRRLRNIVSENFSADACLIMGGANDVIISGEDNDACTEIINCAELCREKGLRPVIAIEPGIALNVNPFYDFQYYDVYFGAMELLTLRLRAKCRDEGLECIDFSAAFRDRVGLTRQDMFIDGVHPTREGHMAMAEIIAGFFSGKK